jgi:protein-tyrosine phosphatase
MRRERNPMNKILNFRELGGIKTSDGGEIRRGVFFRAAELDFADEGDAAELRSLNLKTVFDFRDDREKTDSSIYGRLDAEYYNVPVSAENAKIIKLRTKFSLNALLSLSGGDVCEVYAELPFNNGSYKNFFELIRRGCTPILFHCTAGKDRTGVAAALLLSLLGCERRDITNDYLETKKAVPQIRENMLKNINFLVRGLISKRLTPLFEAEREYIDSALDAVYKKYDGIEAYFMSEYGYSKEDISRLKKLYVVF